MSDINERLLKQILENQQESKDAIYALDKKVDLHIQETRFGFEKIQALDETQNMILEEHHKRSDRLERDNALREQQLRLEFQESTKDIDRRISKLEVPVKWFSATKKALIWLGTIAGSIYTLHRLFDGIFK